MEDQKSGQGGSHGDNPNKSSGSDTPGSRGGQTGGQGSQQGGQGSGQGRPSGQ